MANYGKFPVFSFWFFEKKILTIFKDKNLSLKKKMWSSCWLEETVAVCFETLKSKMNRFSSWKVIQEAWSTNLWAHILKYKCLFFALFIYLIFKWWGLNRYKLKTAAEEKALNLLRVLNIPESLTWIPNIKLPTEINNLFFGSTDILYLFYITLHILYCFFRTPVHGIMVYFFFRFPIFIDSIYDLKCNKLNLACFTYLRIVTSPIKPVHQSAQYGCICKTARCRFLLLMHSVKLIIIVHHSESS